MRPRYRHWSNPKEHPGAVFITTTCLGFAHAFAPKEAKDIVAASLLDDSRHYGARLYGFVVMSNHIHLLLGLPEARTAAWLMARLKSNAARRVMPFVDEKARKALAEVSGLGDRALWQPSYRGLALYRAESFWQKLRYLHLNPVRAGLCRLPEEYRWSSAWMWDEGRLEEDRAIRIDDELIEGYADRAVLDLGRIQKTEIAAWSKRAIETLNPSGGIEG